MGDPLLKTISTFILFLLLKASRFFKRMRHQSNEPLSPIKIGHRGAAGYCPENTYASFDLALELGVDYIEIDIQMTKDGELVVIHDPTVNRTTNGKGRVKDLTLREIQNLDAGGWFHTKFSGEKVPSFSDFLDKYAGKTGLLIEIKKPSLYPGIEEKLASELIKRGLTSDENKSIIVQSFDQNSLIHFHQLLPSIPIGILVKRAAINGLSYKELLSYSSYASYVNPKLTLVTKKLIQQIQRHGFKTMIWTANTKKDIHLLKQYSVEGIISDYPDLV
jgi:glycerophosphoryl diester phosphodiesterase